VFRSSQTNTLHPPLAATRGTVDVSCVVRITSKIDNCNVALAGLQQRDLDRIQSVLNAAARLTADACKFDHVTPLLVNLHWLRVPQRIQYKLCVLVHRCLNGAAPRYLSELIQPLSDVDSRRRLRSASTAEVLVPAIRGAQPLATVLLPSPVHVRAWNSLYSFFLVSHFNFLFIPCGRLSWLFTAR